MGSTFSAKEERHPQYVPAPFVLLQVSFNQSVVRSFNVRRCGGKGGDAPTKRGPLTALWPFAVIAFLCTVAGGGLSGRVG